MAEIDEELLTLEELASAVNLGVNRAVEWSNNNKDASDIVYLSMREQCITEEVAQAQLTKAKSIIEAGEREKIVRWLIKHLVEYDTAEAPEWVYLRFGATQEDWENFIGKP